MKVLRRNYSFSQLYCFRKAALKIIFNYRKMINFLLVEVSVFLRLERNLGLPFNILIEPTGNCNYRCIKCEQFTGTYTDDGMVAGSKDMSFDDYRRIIDDIGDTLITLRLWNYGEPLLNKNLFSMVEYAKTKDIFVAVSSNLSLLDQEASRRVVSSGLDYLIVSCDGATEQTYNLCHGRNYFKKVINNIETLIREKKSSGSKLPFVELQFIVMRDNEGEIKAIAEVAGKLGVNKLTYLKLQADRLDINRLKRFGSIKDILPTKKSLRYSEEERKRINFCRVPWEETLIRYSGNVLACCFDIGQLYAMGKLFQEGDYGEFRKIWNNHNYRRFRKLVKASLEAIPSCSCCEKRNNNSNDQIKIT
ncbi:MAG: radical SAM/SPASM domain-containing protein [Candidatus Omnitrophota bacterium]